MWVDFHKVKAKAMGDDAIYDLECVNKIEKNGSLSLEEEQRRQRESNQDNPIGGFRNMVKLTEFWGDILDEDGEMLYENVVFRSCQVNK